MFLALAVLFQDRVDGACLHGGKTEPFEVSGKFFPVEAMVHDAFGVVLMK